MRSHNSFNKVMSQFSEAIDSEAYFYRLRLTQYFFRLKGTTHDCLNQGLRNTIKNLWSYQEFGENWFGTKQFYDILSCINIETKIKEH